MRNHALVLSASLLSLTLISNAQTIGMEFSNASEVDLSNPHDIKLSADGSRLYVSDVGNDRVVILDPQSLTFIASFGSREQSGTHDVDIDAAGRLYVADTHNHRIAIYTIAGEKATLTGELSGGVRKPEGVLAHPNGRIYVTGAGSGNIVVYANDRIVAQGGGLSAPHDVEMAPNGDLWVADSGHDRMLRLSPELEVLQELSGSPYDFNGQRYLDVAPDGTLVVADKYTHTVKIIGADGKLLQVVGGPGAGKGPNKFRTPEGVELVGDTLWVADSGNDRIVRYRLALP